MNFTLKQFSLGTSLLALACALPAAQAADFEDYARVVLRAAEQVQDGLDGEI